MDTHNQNTRAPRAVRPISLPRLLTAVAVVSAACGTTLRGVRAEVVVPGKTPGLIEPPEVIREGAPALDPPSGAKADELLGKPQPAGPREERRDGKAAESEQEVRRTLARVVNAATTRGSFDDLVSYLSKPDRQRIGTAAHATYAELDQRVTALRKNFRARYNEEFEFKEEHLGTVKIQGTDKASADVTLEAATTPARDAGRSVSPWRTSGARTEPLAAEPQVKPTQPLSAGRDADTTRTPAGGIPATGLHVVNEGNVLTAWRIDVPDAMTGPQLRDALVRAVASIDEQRATWPEDPRDAYRLVAMRVFATLSDTTPAATPKVAAERN